MVVDHQAQADEVDGFDLLSTEQRAAARRTVANHATDADECAEFFRMLGIHPSQERERPPEVNEPKLPNAPKRRQQKVRQAPR